MEFITQVITVLDDIVWGPIMMALILGTGLYLTVGLRFVPWLKLGEGMRLTWHGRTKNDEVHGELSPFQALMTALAATVGTGNIAGVATAIFTGGPGALFWMWCTAMVGMATKFAETVLAQKYREVTPAGHVVGGPMYYIKNGLGPRWAWLGSLFAIFGGLCGFGIGNMTQAHSIADSMHASFGIPVEVTAVAVFVLLAIVVLGGVSRIGAVSGKLVPFMSVVYVLCAVVVIGMNLDKVPGVFALIIHDAFTGTAALGGFAGATVMQALRMGVARGIFSNEAGLGSAAMAHATATTDDAVAMGYVGMLGPFIDTIIICTMTGLTILCSGLWNIEGAVSGAPLTSAAFEASLPGIGSAMVAICLAMFAFSTILGWCVYSERCWIYLLGDRALKPFRIIFVCVVPVGAMLSLDLAWLIADVLNALMAVPNLIGLLLLSPVLFKMVREYNTKN
ncbi:sodium:alanine symporter family protein [uncultured Mailhella sp.]|uniref:alanine/glycine:cation symporter family protein n=1 Tax=uncultured Mailhella sp. TaxID=1981031 RepID=UPI0026388FEF|nr:sodium:alanine symporter family protein [uncultured Mailhella sp.]